MYLGVELEIDNGGECHENAELLLDIMNERNEHIYCKHDGSIADGFEIVSHPCTLGYHMHEMNWSGLMKKALYIGYRSHDTDTCGLHVHVSRNALGNTYDEQDNTIAKILYFVEKNWYEILRFTRRTEDNLNHWACRYGLEPTIAETYNKAKGDYNRYHCINLLNTHTIEFRIFRGTLKHSTFIATLQFVHALCNWCKDSTMEDIYSAKWESFTSTLTVSRYSELLEYLVNRNLY
jgi:hypothetical protein